MLHGERCRAKAHKPPLNRHTPPSLILTLDCAQQLSPSINVELVASHEVFGRSAEKEGRVADLHFTSMCAMLLTASEGERHGTHTRALSALSQRPRHQRRQDQSGSTTL